MQEFEPESAKAVEEGQLSKLDSQLMNSKLASKQTSLKDIRDAKIAKKAQDPLLQMNLRLPASVLDRLEAFVEHEADRGATLSTRQAIVALFISEGLAQRGF